MSQPESQQSYVTSQEIVISSQVFLLEKIKKLPLRLGWGVSEYVQAARELGGGLMYEPVRGIWSKARRELVKSQTSGAGISMLAEPARSEVFLTEYLTRRIPYQILFALIQQPRFTPETLVFLRELQRAITTPEKPVPVRVYAARPGFHSAILDDRLENKIYAQHHGEVLQTVVTQMQGASEKEKIKRVVQTLVSDVQQYEVSGIELNVLGLMVALQHHPNLIFGVVRALLERTTPNNEGSALVQSVVVQPNRIDLSENIALNEMKKVLKILVECGFAGSIIYAPGGGSDRKEEIALLKAIFSNY